MSKSFDPEIGTVATIQSTDICKRVKVKAQTGCKDSLRSAPLETRRLDLLRYFGWALAFFVLSYAVTFSYFPHLFVPNTSSRGRPANIASLVLPWLRMQLSTVGLPAKKFEGPTANYMTSKEFETVIARNVLQWNYSANKMHYSNCTLSPQSCTCFCTSYARVACHIEPDGRSSLVALDRFQGPAVMPQPGCLNLTHPDGQPALHLLVDSNHGLKCYPPRKPPCTSTFEKIALVAIVIPSAPRYLFSQMVHFRTNSGSSTKLDYYMHPTFTLRAAPFLVLTRSTLEELARSCSMLLECQGFTANGRFFTASELQLSHLSQGTPNNDQILYTKKPLSSIPQPFLDRSSGLWSISDSSVKGDERITVTTAGKPWNVSGIAAECDATPDCHHFRVSDGSLFRKRASILEFKMEKGSRVYFRDPPRPTDYVVGTVMSIMDELQYCKAPNFKGRVHLYVADTSTEGNYTALEHLASRLAGLPCVTFLADYGRLAEAALPSDGRGVTPKGHRTEVNQLLDYVSAIETVAVRSPNAALLLWEDDCTMCPGTLDLLDSAVNASLGCRRSAQWAASFGVAMDWSSPANASLCKSAKAADPKFGIFKVGQGGSGLLLHPRIVRDVLVFLKVRRGFDNVDVGIWKYCEAFGLRQYMAAKAWSSHRGQRSSFRKNDTFDALWPDVACQDTLVEQWGKYAECRGADFAGTWMCLEYVKPNTTSPA